MTIELSCLLLVLLEINESFLVLLSSFILQAESIFFLVFLNDDSSSFFSFQN